MGTRTHFYLKLDGIHGRSSDASHFGEMELTGIAWGDNATSGGYSGSGGGGGGRLANPTSLRFTKPYDEASPKLALACANGEHFKEGMLTMVVTNTDNSYSATYTYRFKDVIVSSYLTGGPGSDAQPTDQVGIVFTQFRESYITGRPAKVKGP